MNKEKLSLELERITGINRFGFAEILYEHEGFVDRSNGREPPERDVPQWVEEEIHRNVHSGDCTKSPWPCMRCHADLALQQWDDFLNMILKASSAIKSSTEIADYKKPYADAGHDVNSLFDPMNLRCSRCGVHQIDLSDDKANGAVRTCDPAHKPCFEETPFEIPVIITKPKK